MSKAGRMSLLGRALASIACGDTASTRTTSTQTLRFSHYRTPCVGVGEQLCFVNEDTSGLAYAGVQGWSFRWGFRHELLVEVKDIANPPADAPSVEYSLLEQKTERVPVGTRFSIPVFSRTLITRRGGSTVSLLNAREIDCGARGLCAGLFTALEAARPCISLELSHPSVETAPLVLEGIQPYREGWGCQGAD